MPWLSILLLGYAGLGAVTFSAMAVDKWLARAGARRVPEAMLHTLEFLGGWPGSFAAMVLVHHKNRKPAFILVTIAAAAAHITVWCMVWWLRSGQGDAVVS